MTSLAITDLLYPLQKQLPVSLIRILLRQQELSIKSDQRVLEARTFGKSNSMEI